MGGNHFLDAGLYLINIIFGLYIIAILLRYLLASVRADFYNPLSQMLVKITNPAIKPLRRIIPGYLGVDWPSIILLCFVQGLEIILIDLLRFGQMPMPVSLCVLILAHLIQTAIYVYMVILIIQMIISWVNPGAYNPITVIMYQLSEPLLRPARRLIPPTGGLDWSVLVVFIILNLSLIIIVGYLMEFGRSLAI
jgi:YggT family protein